MITLAATQEIARRIAAVYGAVYSGGMWVGGEPTVVDGDHEGSSCEWIISWEESPAEWVHSEALNDIVKDVLGKGWYAEPITHYAVAFFN